MLTDHPSFRVNHPTEVISYPENLQMHELPTRANRDPREGGVSGRAARAFNVTHETRSDYPSCLAGMLVLPPHGIKDPESVGANPLICGVASCQPGALEIAYGDPDEPEGSFDPATATRFFLRPHALYRIPPGNCYRLENHSETDDAMVIWTILRHRNAPGGGGGQHEGDGNDNDNEGGGGGGSGSEDQGQGDDDSKPAASAARGEDEG
jgi:hypothetical protein